MTPNTEPSRAKGVHPGDPSDLLLGRPFVVGHDDGVPRLLWRKRGSGEERLEALAPLGIEIERRNNSSSTRRGDCRLVGDDAHGGDQQVAHELGIEPGHGERALEAHTVRSASAAAAGADRLEQALGLDVVPLHGLSIASPADREFGDHAPGYDRTGPQPGGSRMEDVWTYRDRSSLGSNVVDTKTDLSGFKVEALDGSIGSIDEATYGTTAATSSSTPARGSSARRSSFRPASSAGSTTDDERVFVNRTKDEIKNAPEFDDAMLNDDTYYSSVGSYYGPAGQGYRSWDDSF